MLFRSEKDTFNFKSGEGITLTAGEDNSITIAANTKKGQISAGDDGFVTGDMVYQAIKDMPVEGSLSGKASTALDNINATGEKKIKDVATNAMLENVETLKDAMGTDEIAENSKDFMTSGAMYTAMHNLQEDWTGTLDSLTKTFAMDDATNLTEENKQKWRATLGTGTNKEGDTGLITGDTLHKALEGINVTGGTVYKAGKHISIGADNTLSVTTDGKVAAGDTGIVTGGQVQEAINKVTEGIATNANVTNKASKDLSNLSDAGKNVIKNTLKADLDNKANAADVYTKGETDQKVAAAVKKATVGIATDANVANKADKDLSNLTEAGKQAIKETMKDELAAKADKSYVDTQLDYMRNFGDSKSNQFSTIPFRIGYQQNLLGFNPFRWDRKIEPLKFEKVKKQYLYNAESVSEEAVNYFFSLAMAQAEYRLAQDNVATTDTLYAIGEQRQKIASISQADLLTLKLDKVNARNTLKNAEISRKRAMSALATFLNMDRNSYIEVDLPARPRHIDIPADRAIVLAHENNPKYVEQRQNVLEAEREVDRTKKEARFNASFNASMGFNQVADNISAAYRNMLQQELVSFTVSIPLVDWGVRKGKYNMAKNNLNVVKIAARQEEISLEEDVMMTVSDFSVQQDMIASAEEALDLADLAYDQTRRRFIIGKADINSLTLALNRQQEARKNYIQALQNYWLNYYKIRKLTLHDFESGMSLADRFDFDNHLR